MDRYDKQIVGELSRRVGEIEEGLESMVSQRDTINANMGTMFALLMGEVSKALARISALEGSGEGGDDDGG